MHKFKIIGCPFSGEARMPSAFYWNFTWFFIIQVYHKLILNQKLGFPHLKGEVAKIDNFNCQFLTEGSGPADICAVSRNFRNLLIYSSQRYYIRIWYQFASGFFRNLHFHNLCPSGAKLRETAVKIACQYLWMFYTEWYNIIFF